MAMTQDAGSALGERQPYYFTGLGMAWHADASSILPQIPSESVQLIITSPPFALRTKKSYGNPDQQDYVGWFIKFAAQFFRILRPDGSLVIDIGGAWLPGLPVRSIYHFELLVALVRQIGFYLAEEFYWYNKAKLPGPAEWVNVRRIRVKDAVNPIWWLSKSPWPKANNRNVLKEYGEDMKGLLRRGYNKGVRPSGHRVGDGFARDNGGAIPSNLIVGANTRWNDAYQEYCRTKGFRAHPARFPNEVPEFFIRFLSDESDLVVDPFAGSNVSGEVAERLNRRWIAIEVNEEFLRGSMGRFCSRSDVPEARLAR